MLEEHRKIIENSINDAFNFRKEFSDFEISSNFQLLTTQLDLFKVIAGLVIGVASIGYIYNENLNSSFLGVSVFFALITLILSVSYTREVIDLQAKQNKETGVNIFNKTEEHINVALKSLKENDSNIFFDYAKERLNDKYPEPQLNYIGEIVIFIFYLSLGSLVMALISSKYKFGIVSCQSIIAITIVYLASFKNWTTPLSNLLSINLTKKPK